MFYIVMSLAFASMLLLSIFRRKIYSVSSIFLCVVLTIIVAILGYSSTKVMYFIENNAWLGQSFYGAVLFFPIVLFPLSLLFRIKLNKLLDYETISGLSVLIWYKLNCYISGCCGGKVLYYKAGGVPAYFPSQIVEMIVAILIILSLLLFEKKGLFKNCLYPLFLIMYGTTRFILNYYRWETDEFVLGLTAGAFWSIVSVIIGVIWIISYFFYNYLQTRKHLSKKEICDSTHTSF